MKNKIFASICVVCLLACMFPWSALCEDAVPYASYVIDTTEITMSSSGGKVYAVATLKTTDPATKIGFTSVKLYHKVDGVWKVAASASNKYGTGVIYTVKVSCNLNSGDEYKATCSAYAVVDGESDTGSASVGATTYY